MAEQDSGHRSSAGSLSPRYRFAVLVDAEALASVLDEPTTLHVKVHREPKGWAGLVDAEWHLGRWSTEDGRAPIEGIAQEHVRWMKQPWKEVNGELYIRSSDLQFWPSFYTRPLTLPY